MLDQGAVRNRIRIAYSDGLGYWIATLKDRDDLRETVYQGYAGTYDFAPLEEGQYAQAGDDLLPTLWSQVQGGKTVVVLPEVAAEGEIQLPPWLP